MSTWTALLIRVWAPPPPVSLAFVLLGVTAATKFIRDHSVEADRNSYWWYNVRSSLNQFVRRCQY